MSWLLAGLGMQAMSMYGQWSHEGERRGPVLKPAAPAPAPAPKAPSSPFAGKGRMTQSGRRP